MGKRAGKPERIQQRDRVRGQRGLVRSGWLRGRANGLGKSKSTGPGLEAEVIPRPMESCRTCIGSAVVGKHHQLGAGEADVVVAVHDQGLLVLGGPRASKLRSSGGRPHKTRR